MFPIPAADRFASKWKPVAFVIATSSRKRDCFQAFNIREFPAMKSQEGLTLLAATSRAGRPGSVLELDGTGVTVLRATSAAVAILYSAVTRRSPPSTSMADMQSIWLRRRRLSPRFLRIFQQQKPRP